MAEACAFCVPGSDNPGLALGAASEQGNFVLHGRLYDFDEVDKGESIAALVSMEFELLDRKTHRTDWTHFYSLASPCKGRKSRKWCGRSTAISNTASPRLRPG